MKQLNTKEDRKGEKRNKENIGGLESSRTTTNLNILNVKILNVTLNANIFKSQLKDKNHDTA